MPSIDDVIIFEKAILFYPYRCMGHHSLQAEVLSFVSKICAADLDAMQRKHRIIDKVKMQYSITFWLPYVSF
jgi:hypothetical protein